MVGLLTELLVQWKSDDLGIKMFHLWYVHREGTVFAYVSLRRDLHVK